MEIETVIAAVALIVSVLASAIAILQTRRVSHLSRTPVLVFTYEGSIARWLLRNVGSGPALNIVVAQHADDGSGTWFNPVAIPAISAGDSFALDWLGDTGRYPLGARYCDFLDRTHESRYFTYARDDRCSVHLPRRQPSWIMPVFGIHQTRRHWERGLPREPPPASDAAPTDRTGPG